MFCSNCGKEVIESARFCMHCGGSLHTNVITRNESSKIVANSGPSQRFNADSTNSSSYTDNTNIKIALATLNTKNIGVVFLLTLFFGPIGLLYSTISGGIVMLLLAIPLFIFIGSVAVKGGLLLGLSTYFFLFSVHWIICNVWGVISASNHNRRLLIDLARTTPQNGSDNDADDGYYMGIMVFIVLVVGAFALYTYKNSNTQVSTLPDFHSSHIA